jgi:23S rRNA pseudouridine1911/1915/1917 synthase
MSHIGHPVLGDRLYGEEEPSPIGRQALHASRLSLIHPITKERVFYEAPLPEDIRTAISRLREMSSR